MIFFFLLVNYRFLDLLGKYLTVLFLKTKPRAQVFLGVEDKRMKENMVLEDPRCLILGAGEVSGEK